MATSLTKIKGEHLELEPTFLKIVPQERIHNILTSRGEVLNKISLKTLYRRNNTFYQLTKTDIIFNSPECTEGDHGPLSLPWIRDCSTLIYIYLWKYGPTKKKRSFSNPNFSLKLRPKSTISIHHTLLHSILQVSIV